MRDRVEKSGLQVDAALAAFIEGEVLGPQGKDAAAFWPGLAALLARLVPVNRALLAKRDDLQAQIDAWHAERAAQSNPGNLNPPPAGGRGQGWARAALGR